MTFDKEVFASRLRGKRAERGLNQTQLAELSGVSVAAITNYENGGYMPSADKVFKLADALGCDLNWLFGWDERKAG